MPGPGLVRPAGAAAATEPPGGDAPASVLIVDDSEVVRRLLHRVVDGDPSCRVIGEAGDGEQALVLARALRPDVIVLDLHMPGLDGYGVLEAVRSESLGARVVVFANVEPEDLDDIERRVKAAGGELVVKPTGVVDADQAMVMIRERLLGPLRSRAPARSPRPGPPGVVKAMVIASSTGGPHALEVVLGNITDLRVPVFVVQHIADGFSGRLADRLNSVCCFPVGEVTDGQRPHPGNAYVGPGGIHLLVERDGEGPVMRLRSLPPVNSCRPSADVLFQSSAEIYGGNQLAVVLTGIGRDGLDGCRALSSDGAPILVQDEATSVVWGMPGAVANAGLADEVLPIDAIAARVQHLTMAGSPSGRVDGPDR